MLAAVHPAITRSEYEEMPPGPPYFQLIEGQLVMSPSPLTKHQRLVGRLYSLLNQVVQEEQLGEVFIAPLDVFLNDINVYQPDIVFLSTARMSQVTEKGIEGAPDLCIEVLSKGTQRFDTSTKKKVFAQSGLIHYWIIDPEARSLSAFNLTENADTPAEALSPPRTFRPQLFPSLEIDLSQLFSGI
jgi:Uma2 family endonuclease